MSTVVQIANLRKQYNDREVVRGININVPAASCFGLLGPNGAGKTTTLRLLLRQSPINGGEIRVFGLPIPQAGRAVRARTGVVPQSDNLDPDFTVAENLRVYGRYFGLGRDVLEPRIRELLAFVELADRADTQIATLSGGMKRRLTIARALINDPELLILDEGKILDHGSPAELIRRHAEPEVIELRGAEATVRAALDGQPDCRIEAVGDTFYCYTRGAAALVKHLEGRADLTFLHRPANLEDVFLKLTGRELRD